VGHTHDEGKTYVGIKDKQVHKFNPEIHTWGASGVVYDKTKDSVMRSVVSNLFNQRIEAKTASAEIESEIVELKRMLKKTA
jgi:outer membrane receptor for ferrienterochelin and colicin